MYTHDDSIPLWAKEIWLNVTLDSDGTGTGFGMSAGWVLSGPDDPKIADMVSIILHGNTTARERHICCSLTPPATPYQMVFGPPPPPVPVEPPHPSEAVVTPVLCDDFNFGMVPAGFWVGAAIVVLAALAAGAFITIGICNWRRGSASDSPFHKSRQAAFDPLPPPTRLQ